MGSGPELGAPVTVIIRANNQHINGKVDTWNQRRGNDGFLRASCKIELNDVIKVFPVDEVDIIFNDNKKRRALFVKEQGNIIEVKNIDMNAH